MNGESRETIVDIVRRHAVEKPAALAVRYLSGDGQGGDERIDERSYAELDRRARSIAAHLQSRGNFGDRAILATSDSIADVEAFLGCLYAGIIAVPAPLPVQRKGATQDRAGGIVRDAQPRFVLTSGAVAARWGEERDAWARAGIDVELIEIERIEDRASDRWTVPALRSDGTAFLQYTSGSTSSPKGVVVGHDNIVANELAIREGFCFDGGDSVVSWLPLYHDMGIVGGLLQPLFNGISLTLMSPRRFLERPARWIEAIARYAGTVSGAPDFAYRLCVERITKEAMRGLDLSSWRLAFTGAEPVRAATLAAFADKFREIGFDARALYPCFGLAESTLFVSGGRRGQGPRVASFDRARLAIGEVERVEGGTKLVGAGIAASGHAIAIVDPATGEPRDEGQIGEIWVRGPSVAHGYWNNEEATRKAFVVRDGARWLRTGDLGFFAEGELFVSGRLKDVIIVRGQNLYPEDIERTIEANVEVVRKGRIAAFPVEVEGREGIGVVAEVGRSMQRMIRPEAVFAAISEAVAAEHLEAPLAMALLEPSALPMTSSGKLRRAECRRGVEQKTIDAFAFYEGGRTIGAKKGRGDGEHHERQRDVPGAPLEGDSPPDDRAAAVAEIWKDVLGLADVAPRDSFFALGGDSITAVQVVARIRERFGVALDLQAFIDSPTLAEFCATVAAGAPASTGGIAPLSRGEEDVSMLPLSHAQLRIWLASQIDPASSAYNIAGVARFAGYLDTDALRASFDALIERHPILRTTYASTEGQPFQRTHARGACEFIQLDLAGVSADDRRRAAQERAASEARRPFDIERGPVLRAVLLRWGTEECLLVVAMHHIAGDGRSITVLIEELAELYGAQISGRAPALPPIAARYADYVRYQQRLVESDTVRHGQLEYWKKRLGDEHPSLELPRASSMSRGGSVVRELAPGLANALRRLASSHGTTLFTVFLAAFDLLLYRHTGQRDLRVGVPIADRDQRPVQDVVGAFVNMAVLRCEIRGDMTFEELLRAVREAAIGAIANKDLPFERLAFALSPERSATRHPLFQVTFNHLRSDFRALRALPGARLEGVERLDTAAQYDLSLDTEEDANGKLVARWTYGAVLDAETVGAMASRFVRLLEQIAELPTRRLGDLVLLERAELERIDLWNRGPRGADRTNRVEGERPERATTVAALIARHAAANPDVCAILGGGRRLSYGDLERRANRLAHRLREFGVGHESIVGISAERSPDVIVAMLGVWKAGGAFVSLDPAYPAERLAFMLADARASVLLTETSVSERVAWPRELRVLLLDEEETCGVSDLPPSVETRPDHLAYVVYTSGSTGQPKGVLVAHGALTMHTVAAGAIYRMSASDAAIHFASMSFDAAIEQWAVPLAHGARLVLGEADWTAEQTARILTAERVTVIYPPTSHAVGLAEWALREKSQLGVRVICVGGEAVSRASYERIQAGLEPEKIINGYGPTETVITPLLWEAGRGASCESAYAPIGRPVGERTAYVLDADRNLVPRGVVGELYIGGAGLARGYLGRAALTAERFVPDPFSRDGGRLYRTGDLVRYDDTGVVEYLGRADEQVKIRGFRIELGEIETRLLEDARIAEAVVVVNEARESKKLVAYVSPSAPALRAGLGDEVRSALSRHLPEYMVPSAIVVLDRLPRTPNGKVDRRALPEPSLSRRVYVAPRTPAERALAAVWQRLLGVDQVGRADHFFELGGDSIVAIQMVSRARRAGWLVAPRDVFSHPTVEGLARIARESTTARAIAGTSPTADDVPLSPIQATFFARELANRSWFNQALLLVPRENLEVNRLRRAFDVLMGHHDSLRLRFERVNGHWRQRYGVTDGSPLSVREVTSWDCLGSVAAEVQQSLSIEHGPVFRAVLARRGDRESRLLLVAHHLVVDAVSWRILLEDLETIYRPTTCSAPAMLPERTSSYQAWSRALGPVAESAARSSEMAFWEKQGGAARDLPRDLVGDRPRRREAECVTLQLDADATSRLLHETAGAFRTQINDLLLAAVVRAVAPWIGRPTVAIELEGHGRDEIDPAIDLTRTVGWFTTAFPIALPLERDLGENILAIKECLRHVPKGGIGFGLLAHHAESEVAARLAKVARPRITFNYLGQTDGNFGEGALFDLAGESAGPVCAPEELLDNWIVIEGRVAEGALRLEWTFAASMFHRSTMQRVVDSCERELRAILELCTSGASGVSSSDFPQAALSMDELRSLPVPACKVEDIRPLTPLQQGILFHALELRAGDPYFYQRGFAITGALEPAALRRAWMTAARRHAALRTTFHWSWVDRPMQIALSDDGVSFVEEDWRGSDREAQWEALRRRLERERAEGFDFATRGAVNLSLLRVEDGAWWMVWSLHHLALDGWSTAIVLRDVQEAYVAEVFGSEPPSRDTAPFSSYLQWLAAANTDEAKGDWARELAGFETMTPLPLAGSPIATLRGDRFADHVWSVDPEIWRKLRKRAVESEVTTATILQSAWALVLGLFAGERDVVFGVTTSGRSLDLAGVDQMVGLLINTLPLRVKWSPDQEVQVWVRATHATCAACEQRPVLSISEIQNQSSLRDGGALFESLVVVENYPIDEALRGTDAPWRVELLEHSAPGGVFSKARNNYPLTFVVGFGDAPPLTLAYDASRFDAGRIAEIARQLTHVLGALANHEVRSVGDIGLAVGENDGFLLGAARTSPLLGVLEAWERNVAARADHAALYDESGPLTYREADAAARRLANRLRASGVARGDVVGLYLDRSRELVVAILAIWKAGGAYLPIERRWPENRVEQLIADAGARLVVCASASVPLVAKVGAKPILVDDASGPPAATADFSRAPTAEDAAYLIYTSGSTGTPKGVVITHGSLANYVSGVLSRLQLPAVTSMAMVSTPAADLGHTALFAALAAGHPLHLLSADCMADADRFADYMTAHDVGVLKIVPSQFRELFGEGARPGAIPRDALILGGEASHWELVEEVRRARTSCRVFNHYGPTESTVGATMYEVGQRDARFATVPLGRPLLGLDAWILDPNMNRVPDGVAGELYIGGEGLARGYHARPAATAERFIPHPFRVGMRLYRTGDRALLRGGAIEFLGRADDQVKIRGFRVEVGEVLAALRSTEGVSDGAVVVDSDAHGRASLLAYYVPSAGAPGGAGIEGRLAARLPDYMMPALIELDRLPLTPNGKLDRKALPRPVVRANERVPPRSPVEAALCEIWRDVLRVENVGVHDDFFELGGDSILSLRIIARSRKRGIQLTPKQLFSAKTIARLAELVGVARARERTLIPLVARREKSPTSFAQQRLWFLSQLEPNSAAYHIAGGLRLKGPIDRAALDRSLRDVVARHEALRTVFPTDDDGATQRILPSLDVPIDERDLRTMCRENTLDDAIAALSREEAERPFDLDRGPLLRVTLIRTGEAEHVLLLTMHHIVSDGWSMNILMREFAGAYAAHAAGREPALANIAIQYRDYAAWQRRWLDGGESEKQLAYWKRQLGDDPSPPPLFERAHVRSPRRGVGKVTIPFGDRHESDVARAAKEHETTPFIVLLSAFSVLLYRHTGRGDLRVGVPAANRRLTETEGLIGLFVNTQVVRIAIDGASTFAEIVERTKNASLEAQAHQDLPFERLVEAVHPTRRLGQTPLFQVLCNFQRRETSAMNALPGLTIEMFERAPVAAQFDIAFDGEQTDQGVLGAVLRYAADVLDPEVAARLATHFVRILGEAVESPDRRVADFDVLTCDERRELRHADATERAYGGVPFVHDAIAAQARATPDATALLFGLEALSYRELERRANHLAQRLRAEGVGPDVVVGVMLERSFELVVTILAVLRAGGAYLPIDPDLPAARIAYMLADADVRTVVTTAGLAGGRDVPRGIRVLLADDANVATDAVIAPAPRLSKKNVAYVIYTSGSTGRPKGAANTHAGLANRLHWMQDAYRLARGETVLQKTPFSFDVSVWELLWPLMVGARMRIAPPGAHRDPARLIELIVGDGVSTVHFVPSMLDAFLESEGSSRCTSLRRIVASGEALRAETVSQAASKLGKARLYNLYGPTEASIDVTHWSCVPTDATSVPIGAPIANTTIRILDADLNEVPTGVAGELYIGGVGLAREYWRNAKLTAERFIPDPWSSEPGERLYRTGDRALRRRDGNFEYLGRVDDQVKIRGFRVELGEIESALLKHEGVEQAAAVVRKDGRGGTVVAYVVPKPEFADVIVARLRRHLREVLPEFMVPNPIVVLDALPRLPSGKVDRQALPDAETPRAEHAPPRSTVEKALAVIWQTLLGVEKVGRQDDFFELGGHSLLAIRLVARVKEELGVAVPLATVFRATTLERFSEEVERAGARTITDEKMQKLDALLTELESA